MKKLCLIIIMLLTLSTIAESLRLSGSHALYLDANGSVWAWGSNIKGESVYDSDAERVLEPQVVFTDALAIAAGKYFSMALNSKNDLYIWGGESEPKLIAGSVIALDACDELAGYVSANGKAYMYVNDESTLIAEGCSDIAIGMDFALLLYPNGDVYKYSDEEPAKVLDGCTDIAAYGETCLYLKTDGSVYISGASANDGRLLSSYVAQIDTPFYTGLKADALVPGLSCSGVITQGELWVWGAIYSYMTAYNDSGDSAVLNDGILISYGATPVMLYQNVAAAAFGDAFAVVLKDDGTLLAWGSNESGQAGAGYTKVELYEDEDGEYEAVLTESAQCLFPNTISCE